MAQNNGVALKRPARKSVEVLDMEEEESHAYVPHPDYGLKYVHREVHGVQDFDLLEMCMEKAWNLLLRGDTGSGKTMLPMAYASKNLLRYFTVPCDISIDPRALFGKMMPTEKMGEFKWVDGPVTEMVRNGGILNISEINFMPAKIAASLYPLLDHRRSLTLLEHEGETIRPHGPNCWCEGADPLCRSKWLLIVADMNPKYRGTTDLNLALANRFPVKVNWGYLDSVENALVKSKELLIIVRKVRKQVEVRTPISTNSMMEFIEMSTILGIEFATQNFLNMFSDTEVEPVRLLMDAASENIKRDIDALQAGKKPDDMIPDAPDDSSWYNREVNPDDFEWAPE